LISALVTNATATAATSVWPDPLWVSVLSTIALAIGAVGGTLGIILTALKIREHYRNKPKNIATHLAPKLRELRRVLLQSLGEPSRENMKGALAYWGKEFFMRGHEDDLRRIQPWDHGCEIISHVNMIRFMLTEPPDETARKVREMCYYNSKDKSFLESPLDPTKIKNHLQRHLYDAVQAIDRVLELAEGA